ncbi:MAG TPA: DNA polymerase III subunit gamma/tau [Bacillota bacterium]|nr:DNA polymerase III subunit gamma/tau [Bacillota bacterium]
MLTMSYQSLYREWRPTTFSEVSGQEHIKRTLGNMLQHARIPHALLFCGPRGTGKTTMAKIFAKAVNCMEGVSATPCLKCKNCLGVANNTSLDVIEIDAASNRGIDEIRQLRDQVRFSPTESRHKVYIIDEVHMLTTEAFNALLKTLEEPPAHVVFILATTEPHKLPLTIISRCQRFDFHRLSSALIRDRLIQVAAAKEADLSPAAALTIAQLAEGGMRDALGVLEQSIAYGEGVVTVEVVQQVTGSMPLQISLSILQSLTRREEAEALRVLGSELDGGREATQLLASYLKALRLMLLGAHAAPLLEGLGYEAKDITAITETAGHLGTALPRFVELALNTEAEMRYGGHPRLHLELLLVQQGQEVQGASPAPARKTASVQVAKPPAPRETKPASLTAPPEPVVEVASTASTATTPQPVPPVSSLLKAWPKVVAVIRKRAPLTASTLGVVTPLRMDGNVVLLQMMENNAHTYKRLMSDIDQIRAGLGEVLGQQVEVRLLMNGNDTPRQEPEIDPVREALDLFKGKIVKDE